MSRINILGVRVDEITYPQAMERVKTLLEKGGRHYIVTPNPEIIMLAQKDAEFKKILNEADLSVPDGIGVVWAGKLLHEPIFERVSGVDLVYGLSALAAERGFTMFLLGGRNGVPQRAAQNLKDTYSGLKIVGSYEGDSRLFGDKEILAVLKGKQIDILAVAYGAPKQEKWIARNLPDLDVKLAIGVGGALDYISGEKKRAPRFVQKTGFEWLFRLLGEPWRARRQLALLYFAYLVIKEKFKNLIGSPPTTKDKVS